MNKQISEESAEVYSTIEEMEHEINSRAGFKEKIEEIKSILQKAENDASKEMIDSAFVNKYIDKIYVTPIDDGVIEISVKLFTGDTFGKIFEKLGSHLVGRTGHTFKKMIESYENSMK